MGIELRVHSVNIDSSKSNIEEAARLARYQVFKSEVTHGDVLMQGHHLDDQVETMLMRLLRGSGTRGVAGIPFERAVGSGQLMRPLLTVKKQAIEAYAKEHELRWIEDPSNQSDAYDRNFLRLKVLPLLAQRWPQYRDTLARAAKLSGESDQLNRELADEDMKAVGWHQLSVGDALPLVSFTNLSRLRKKNVLRYWLAEKQLLMPSAAQLSAIIDEVVAAREDASPIVSWSGMEARKYRGHLLIAGKLPPFNNRASYPLTSFVGLPLPGVGELNLSKAQGQGIAAAHVETGGLIVKFRVGGERCQPAGRSHSQTLKKLLQEYQVAPWFRERIPLIYKDEELVAVGDLWVCEGWQASELEAGFAIQIKPEK